MAGRKTKLTGDVQARICKAIRAGTPFKLACEYGGIGVSTFYQWLERGERESGEYAEFREAVKAAEADAVVALLAKINLAATEHWQAAAWILERRYPHEFGRTVREHAGKVETQITVSKDARGVAEEIAGLLAERATRQREGKPSSED
jgi:hypothetical protein